MKYDVSNIPYWRYWRFLSITLMIDSVIVIDLFEWDKLAIINYIVTGEWILPTLTFNDFLYLQLGLDFNISYVVHQLHVCTKSNLGYKTPEACSISLDVSVMLVTEEVLRRWTVALLAGLHLPSMTCRLLRWNHWHNV